MVCAAFLDGVIAGPLVHACLLSGFCVSEGKWTQTSRGKKDENLNYYVDVGTWELRRRKI